MSRPQPPHILVPSAILYENADHTIVVVDVPRSIEEAQEEYTCCRGASSTRRRRLLSRPPPTTPFSTPSGSCSIGDAIASSQSLAARLAELTARAAVDGALDHLSEVGFDGPWCLPRQMHSKPVDAKDDAKEEDGLDPDNKPFRIPPRARYLEGTIEACRDRFLSETPQFDLIVLDPPWPNRSARRRRQGRKRRADVLDGNDGGKETSVSRDDDVGYDTAYNMVAMREMLEQIPVGAKLAAAGGHSLVAVWVTNKAGCEAMLTDPKRGLFRDWGVELVATWTWLKVTTSGEPVVPLDSQWRKPWERLLLARRPIGAGAGAGSADDFPPPPPPPPPLPAQRVIVSVPDLHSRKPNLRPLVSPFIMPAGTSNSSHPPEIVGLEVFARNLTAGWWAWGNEALLFQHVSWWADEGSRSAQAQDAAATGTNSTASQRFYTLQTEQ